MSEFAYEMNVAAARLAREAADAVTAADPDRPRFVAGALGPTNRTASISPDVNDPGARNVTYEELVQAYLEQANGLVDGGADLLIVETIFDTLNAKAAIFALETLFDERGRRWPVVISGTITDASGRTLSGQVTEAFWNSVRHARPLLVGLNCALGASEMRPYLAELARVADCFVSCYPNAGLPNAFGEYDEVPEQTATILRELPAAAWSSERRVLRNHAGARGGDGRGSRRATPPGPVPRPRPPVVSPVSNHSRSPRRRCSSTWASAPTSPGRRSSAILIRDGDYNTALAVARQQVENGAQIIDVNMDEGMIDGVAAMDRFLKLIAENPTSAGCR